MVSPLPPAPEPTPSSSPPERIGSVDALRGLVIALMVFVNDLASAPHAPAWLKHTGAEADAMTLPDIVFPGFLFMAGVSIPLAFSRALAEGRSRLQLLGKVLARTFGLLVMGVVMVNGEDYDPWNRALWMTLAFLAMGAAFAVVPAQPGRARNALRTARALGAVTLVALLLVYRTAEGRALVLGPLFDGSDTVWLRHSWWGILGLIGWAYLVASLVYLAVGRRREWLVGAVGVLVLFYVADQAPVAAQLAARPWLAWAAPVLQWAGSVLGVVGNHVGFGSTLGSQAAVTVAGCCLGSILADGSEVQRPAERIRWALGFAAGLFFVGWLLDAPYGISKIRGTPAWCLYCAAATTVAWAALYWLMDLRGVAGWARFVRPAGSNPLLAYLLHPLFWLLVGLAGPGVTAVVQCYANPAWPADIAVLGSLVVAFLVVQATGWIARAGFRLKV